MIEQDYFMRMMSVLAALLARILFYKQKRDFPRALLEIENTGKTLLGVDRMLIGQLSASQLMGLFGADLTAAVPKSYVLAILLKEEAEVRREMGEIEKSDFLFLKALTLFLDSLAKGGKPVERDHVELTDETLEALDECTLPVETLKKVFDFQLRFGRWDRAEDALFEILPLEPDFREEGLRFYKYLTDLTDEQLKTGNLPRDEVLQAIAELEEYTREKSAGSAEERKA